MLPTRVGSSPPRVGSARSALTVMRDGNAIEVETVGNEGVVGHYGNGGERSPHRTVVQVEDGGRRSGARALQEEGAKGGFWGSCCRPTASRSCRRCRDRWRATAGTAWC